MKKLIIAIVLISFFNSCSPEFGSNLGGYKAPNRRVCYFGQRNAVWQH